MTTLTMTLLVRNEEDIVEDNIRFHHAMGVDEFIVMDNLSEDSTLDILARLSSEIPITILHQSNDDYNQGEWVTEMARLAAQRNPDGWIINSDADEFWCPSRGTLKEYINSISPIIATIDVTRSNAVVEYTDHHPSNATASPGSSLFFECVSRNSVGVRLPTKCIHRASTTVTVGQGNHEVIGVDGEIHKASVDEITILHYPHRSLKIYERKILLGGAAYARNLTLNQNVGMTWRRQYDALLSDGLEDFWVDISHTFGDVIEGLAKSEIYFNPAVKLIVTKQPSRSTPSKGSTMIKEIDDLLDDTRNALASLVKEMAENIARAPKEDRHNRPMFWNFNYCINGALKQLEVLSFLRFQCDGMISSSDLGLLRDAFSLFPSNNSFLRFLSNLAIRENPHDATRLSTECQDEIVCMHITCAARLYKARLSQSSFNSDKKFRHIFVVGTQDTVSEPDVPLAFSYSDGVLYVPVPDSYEFLHRKVFYALMLIDLICEPKIVIKLDDDLHLSDKTVFLDQISDALNNQWHCSGRVVGSSTHSKQWHGWHIGKCQDKQIENRGYQYPLPSRYPAGGFGYTLDRTAISACSYMYLSMLNFFNMPTIGLEDVYIGHALSSAGIKIEDVSSPVSHLAFPGLSIRKVNS